jgi:hypothetical protein
MQDRVSILFPIKQIYSIDELVRKVQYQLRIGRWMAKLVECAAVAATL